MKQESFVQDVCDGVQTPESKSQSKQIENLLQKGGERVDPDDRRQTVPGTKEVVIGARDLSNADFLIVGVLIIEVLGKSALLL